MKLLKEYKKLLEKKDHIIKRLRNLTDEQKNELINFFNKKPNLESKIDWNNKDLTFDDFKEIMNTSKTERKKSVKNVGISGLVLGEDYLDFPTPNKNFTAYIPLNYEASKLIASKDIGYCEGKWCTAYQKTDKHWNEYVVQKEIVLIYIIGKNTKYALACSLKLLDADKEWIEVFNKNDNKISVPTFKDISGISDDYLIRYRKILEKSQEFIQSKISIYDKYGLKNYIINPDGTVDVDGDVGLSNKNLDKIPFKFGKVTGNFYCYYNNLTSLEGAPREIGGNFYCYYNNLNSLEGAPREIGGNFYCYYNNLNSLEGAPREVGGSFYCSYNNLNSLEGAPREVSGDFYCNYNKLTSLE
ncbi:MAG: hypothetical protein M0R03_20315, partial [Novosphingobium sp.]|nr:hypothetical protein [Novosphingobium sp.]